LNERSHSVGTHNAFNVGTHTGHTQHTQSNVNTINPPIWGGSVREGSGWGGSRVKGFRCKSSGFRGIRPFPNAASVSGASGVRVGRDVARFREFRFPNRIKSLGPVGIWGGYRATAGSGTPGSGRRRGAAHEGLQQIASVLPQGFTIESPVNTIIPPLRGGYGLPCTGRVYTGTTSGGLRGVAPGLPPVTNPYRPDSHRLHPSRSALASQYSSLPGT